MNERKFKYDTFPYEKDDRSFSKDAEAYIYDVRQAPCPCPYCYMNQHKIVDQAQSPFVNQSVRQNQSALMNSDFQASEKQFTNPNIHEPVNQLMNENFGGPGQPPHLNQRTNTEINMLQQFLTEDGQVDIQKMLQTIGQFADTVQQVSPVIKQINDLIKSFRT